MATIQIIAMVPDSKGVLKAASFVMKNAKLKWAPLQMGVDIEAESLPGRLLDMTIGTSDGFWRQEFYSVPTERHGSVRITRMRRKKRNAPKRS